MNDEIVIRYANCQVKKSKSVVEKAIAISNFRSGGAPQAAHFANVEDMLFEVFRCEETDTFDRISIRQFLKVSRQ